MKICLVNTNFVLNKARAINFPTSMGLLMLAAVLENEGYEVEYIDLPWLIKDKLLEYNDDMPSLAARIIIKGKPQIIGFTTRCDTFPTVVSIAKKCKKFDHTVTVVFGGPHATFIDEILLSVFDAINIVVRGEGERTILKLVSAIEDNFNLSTVKGITFKKMSGEIVRNNERDVIENLDLLPLPAYHLLEDTLLKDNQCSDIAFPIIVGRGCPFECSFCSTSRMWKRRYRLRSPKNIIKEIVHLKKKYGATRFCFEHDNLAANRNKLQLLCNDILEHNLELEWSCSTRTDCVDSNLLNIMARAGCKEIYFGIESGSQRIQNLIGKNLSISMVPIILKECANQKIDTIASFIVGFPGETISELNRTLSLALEAITTSKCKSVQIHALALMPGTKLLQEYQGELEYTGLFSDQVREAKYLLRSDIELIKSHPMMFAPFYQLKQHIRETAILFSTPELARILTKILNTYGKSIYIAIKETSTEAIDLILNICSLLYKKNIPLSHVVEQLPCLLRSIYADLNIPSSMIDYLLKYEKAILDTRQTEREPVKKEEKHKSNAIQANILCNNTNNTIPYLSQYTIISEIPYDPEELLSRLKMNLKPVFPTASKHYYLFYHSREGGQVIKLGFLSRTCLQLVNNRNTLKVIVDKLLNLWQPMIPSNAVAFNVISILDKYAKIGIVFSRQK